MRNHCVCWRYALRLVAGAYWFFTMVQLASMKNAISNPQEACSLKHTVPHNDTHFFTITAAYAPNITGSGIWKPNLEIHPSQASGQSIGKEGRQSWQRMQGQNQAGNPLSTGCNPFERSKSLNLTVSKLFGEKYKAPLAKEDSPTPNEHCLLFDWHHLRNIIWRSNSKRPNHASIWRHRLASSKLNISTSTNCRSVPSKMQYDCLPEYSIWPQFGSPA